MPPRTKSSSRSAQRRKNDAPSLGPPQRAPSINNNDSNNREPSMSLSPKIINNELISQEHQHYAASLILPISTLGYILMIFAFNYYLGHKLSDHIEYAIYPSCAFSTAWLLWHRYEPCGWRRNLDIFTTCSAIAVQTFNMMKKCPCGVHVTSYLLASAVGIGLFVVGSFAKDFRSGMKWHVMCHLAAYVCNALLYRCIALSDVVSVSI